VHPQRQEGLYYLGIPVPVGRVTGTALIGLADLADDIGGDVRFTRQQNVILTNIPADKLDQVRTSLSGIGFDPDRTLAFGRSVACTSHQFCNYSVAETKGKLTEIIEELADRHGPGRVGDLAIHMDGCPHACAQHWIGEIGLQGTTTRVDGEGERVEAYDLTVGGALGARTAIGRRLLRRVPTSEITSVLDRLVTAWLDERDRNGDTGFGFGDFCARHDDEQLLQIATALDPVSAATDVRLEGALQ
jgi:ferredoxin-nitrite reductase